MKHFLLIHAIILIVQNVWAQKDIDQVYEIFSEAYSTYDSELIKNIYNDQAFYLSPGQPIESGSDVFIMGFKSMFEKAKQKDEKLNIEFNLVDRNTQGDVVIDIGYYKLTRTSSENEIKSFVGKFITVLKKSDEGNWQFITDGYSNAPLEAYPD